MANGLTDLANGLFNRRQQEEAPKLRMLGTGVARDTTDASGILLREYQTRAAIAQANGEEFPSYEEWVALRR